jgi:uncharacterized protein involved in type VI secretion and phage assembly
MYNKYEQYQIQIQGITNQPIRALSFSVEDFGISRHYVGQVELVSSDKLKFDKLVQRNACIEILYRSSYFHGIITGVQPCANEDPDNYYYCLTIESPLYLLSFNQTTRVFVKEDLKTIIDKLFKYQEINYKIIAKQKLPSIEFQIQVNESDLAFLERILSQEGWFYFFTQAAERPTLIITDDITALPTCQKTLDYCPQNGLNSEESIYNLSQEQEILHGETDARELQVHNFTLRQGGNSVNYRILKMSLHGSQAYSAKFTAQKTDLQYKPPIISSPKYYHTLPAIIWGYAGYGCYLDEEGRYQVKFALDTDDTPLLELTSIPIKMLRPYVAPYSPDGAAGMHFPLKKGTQVAVCRFYGW